MKKGCKITTELSQTLPFWKSSISASPPPSHFRPCVLRTKFALEPNTVKPSQVCSGSGFVFLYRDGKLLVVTVLRESNHGILLSLLTVCAPYLTKACRRQPLKSVHPEVVSQQNLVVVVGGHRAEGARASVERAPRGAWASAAICTSSFSSLCCLSFF